MSRNSRIFFSHFWTLFVDRQTAPVILITIMIMNIRLVDAEEDDARLNWELVFNLITAALAVLLVLYLGGFKGF